MSELDVLLKLRQIERELNELRRQMASGDMLKSVYDANNNGIVDAAESVPWAGVTGRPLGYYWLSATINPSAGLSAGSHVFTRATHFPSVPAEATHIEIGVLFRWNATPSTSNRAYINDGPGWPVYVPHTTSWYEPAQQAKVKLDANQAITLTIEGANMTASYIYLRGYWA